MKTESEEISDELERLNELTKKFIEVLTARIQASSRPDQHPNPDAYYTYEEKEYARIKEKSERTPEIVPEAGWCLKLTEGEKLGGIEVEKNENDGIRVEKSQPKAPTYQELAEMGQKDSDQEPNIFSDRLCDELNLYKNPWHDHESPIVHLPDAKDCTIDKIDKDAEDDKSDGQFDPSGPCYRNERRLENENFPPEQFRGYNASPGQVIRKSAKMGIKRKKPPLDEYIIEIKIQRSLPDKNRKGIG
ncbi:7472_t:CDS:2, partial [Racocetra fulgida]